MIMCWYCWKNLLHLQGITHFTNPALEHALAVSPVVVIADPAECSFQFNPVGTANYSTSCDLAKSALIKLSVNYNNQGAPPGTKASVQIGNDTVSTTVANFTSVLKHTVIAHGYPDKVSNGKITVGTKFLLCSRPIRRTSTTWRQRC
jgi:hypothetical protein